MDLLTIFVWIFTILILVSAHWYLTMPSNLPPGAAGIPILGNAPFISRKFHLQATSMGEKYGNVFHLYIGSVLVIILNDFAAMKDAMIKQSDVFSTKYEDADVQDVYGEFPGILFSNGEFWRQHRRFLLHNFKDYGVGKSSLEPQLLEEIRHFIDVISKQNGADIDIKAHLTPSLTNNIQILVTGQRVDYEHPRTKAIVKALQIFEEEGRLIPIKTFFPWTRLLIDTFYPKRLHLVKEMKCVMTEAIKDAIVEVKSKYVDGQSDNYIQAYLTEKKNRLKKNKNENIFTKNGLLVNTQDLLLAGTETLSGTLAWSFLYMAFHPDVQKRVQREIDDVIGRHREPSYADRINTPYTEATINELHRAISLVPFGLPRKATQDTHLLGHHIPKDAFVICNHYAVHHDVTLWGDPKNFRPERFIGPNGECVRPDYLVPFSIGKRACVGESLARMEIYLYFVSLLQNFDIIPPKGVKMTLEALPGALLQAKSYLVRLKARSL